MPEKTYTNPLSRRSFPDPFVLKWNGRYYGYATGDPVDGRVYGVIWSDDLIHWHDEPGALIPLDDPDATQYWAPEVAYRDGVFTMYYCVIAFGTQEHHLRVATSRSPLGPFQDCGVNLTPDEIFAIDAHPFQDEDGQWYLFYARDYLEAPFVGTGLAVDRLETMTRLSGKPARVLRPYAEWQLYERQRAEKGGMDWYTAEGAFMQKRHGRYICLYSGGAWQFPNYGVADVVSDIPMGPHGLEDRNYQDLYNAGGPQILRTTPDKVLGPGHNSVVLGPNNVDPYLVYHGWDPELTARMIRIDRLFWRFDRPGSDGPSVTPQPAPALPSFLDGPDRAPESFSDRWESANHWRLDGHDLAPETEGADLLARFHETTHFLFEINLRFESGGNTSSGGPAGVLLVHPDGSETAVLIDPAHRELLVGAAGRSLPIPEPFTPDAWKTLLIRKDADLVEIRLDGRPVGGALTSPGAVLLKLYGGPDARFGAVRVTPHFANDFSDGIARGWTVSPGGRWVVASESERNLENGSTTAAGGRIEQRDPQARFAQLTKSGVGSPVEIAADITLLRPVDPGARVGIALRGDGRESVAAAIFIEYRAEGWGVGIEVKTPEGMKEAFRRVELATERDLPSGSLRARVEPDTIAVSWRGAFPPGGVATHADVEIAGADIPGDGVVALFTMSCAATLTNVIATQLA